MFHLIIISDKVNLMPSREEYDRSLNNDPLHSTTTTDILQDKSLNHTIQSDCSTPRYKKTIIRTITSTFLIEILSENDTLAENETRPLVKKRVEENTLVEREFLCNF